MKKVNITMASGNMLIKPLVTAFRGSGGEYIVLDNEINGSMGLPIILVSKLSNNKLVKITDQNEWNAVKDTLRNIISGNQMEYIDVPENINGDDLFFSQLTLPVASFEVLKSNYKPLTANQGTQVTQQLDQSLEMNPTPQENPVSQMGPVSQPSVEPQTNTPEPEQPNEPFVSPFTQQQPEKQKPASVINPFIQPQAMGNMEKTQVVQEPVNNSQMKKPAPVDYSDEKEAFLKACGNMFDALVAKFNK